MSRLRRFDAYPKTLEDFRVKTFSGAAGEAVYDPLSLIFDSFHRGWCHDAHLVCFRAQLLHDR